MSTIFWNIALCSPLKSADVSEEQIASDLSESVNIGNTNDFPGEITFLERLEVEDERILTGATSHLNERRQAAH
jgi:hypothetical protein